MNDDKKEVKELKEEELEKVNGGICVNVSYKTESYIITYQCDKCDYSIQFSNSSFDIFECDHIADSMSADHKKRCNGILSFSAMRPEGEEADTFI